MAESASPADLLRQAATLMRERARAATAGPWSGDPTGTVCAVADLRPGDGHDDLILPEGGPMEVAECYRNEYSGERGANAEHIASWHPVVALAVADLLDFSAATSRILDAVGQDPDNRRTHHYALAVARAYLGIEVAA